jgi:DNA modification methylase
MPESVTDRPTKSHEYIFLLSKSERYFYDAAAIMETAVNGEKFHGHYSHPGVIRNDKNRNGRQDIDNNTLFRNKRSVWTITTRSFKEAHFATFPPELPRLCILAGCPEGGTVLDPFSGAGTTGLVALRLGREYIGIELNPEYVEMSQRRIVNDAPLFNSNAGQQNKGLQQTLKGGGETLSLFPQAAVAAPFKAAEAHR